MLCKCIQNAVSCILLLNNLVTYLWWLTAFQKLLISFVARRQWIHQTHQVCAFERLCDCMGNQSHQIETPSFSHFQRNLWKKFGTRLWYNTSYHLQTDAQIEVVNRSFGDLLRCLVGENPKQWEAVVTQAEFAYNYFRNPTTSKKPF